MSDDSLVPLFGEEWGTIDTLVSGLDDDEWDVVTECPGWTVKDNVSHLIGVESLLLGRPEPADVVVGDLEHVKNDFGRANEVAVEARRGRPAREVLAEFREVTSERLDALRSLTPDDFAKDSWTPAGPGTYRDFMNIRLFDCWMHEQDIRRAVGRPGNLSGPVADRCYERIKGFMPFVVGKKAAAEQGATVAFVLTGPVEREFCVGVEGRAKLLDAVPPEPDVWLRMDFGTLVQLVGGRRTADELRREVDAEGPAALAGRVVHNLNVMF